MRCGTLPRKTTKDSGKDDRITIKIDKGMWKAISKQMREHPEWGLRSVSEFIRPAISRELEASKSISQRKVFEIQLRPRLSPEDSRGRDPGEPPS